MGLIDTHAHYDDPRFDPDRDGLLASLPERGVGLVVNWRALKLLKGFHV